MKMIILFTILLFFRIVSGQIVDKSFGSDGYTKMSLSIGGSQVSYVVNDIAIQPSGKILLFGTTYDGTYSSTALLIRLDSNGKFDSDFGYKSYSNSFWDYWAGVSISIDSKNRILLNLTVENGSLTRAFSKVVRLLENGEMDQTFNGIGQSDFSFLGDVKTFSKGITILKTGEIVMGASSNICETCADMAVLARFTESGRRDSTLTDPELGYQGFRALNLGSNENINAINKLPDGSILASFSAENSFSTISYIVKYLHSGKLDSTFGTNGILTIGTLGAHTNYSSWFINSIEPLNDGRIILGGYTMLYNSKNNAIGQVYCIDMEGKPNATFGTNGLVEIDKMIINDLEVLPNGNILAVGSQNEQAAIVRLLSNGKIDPHYGNKVIRLESFGNNINTIKNINEKYIIGGFKNDGVYLSGVTSRCHNTYNESSTSLSNYEIYNKVQIYPNPAKDIINVTSDDPINNIKIIDVQGKVIFKTIGNFSNLQSIDLKGISPGIYIISVNSHTQKLIIN